jgi:hypothetical protein
MLGQPAGLKVDLENSEPQESRRVIGLHGKPRRRGDALTLLTGQAGYDRSEATVFARFSGGPRFQPKTIACPLRE